jgi:hypothetical protein
MDNRLRTTRRLPTGGSTSSKPRERGVSLVEMAISTSLLVAILGMIYTTADVASSVSRSDAAKMRGEVAYRDAFYRMRGELVNATMQKDPHSNLPRYSIFFDTDGEVVPVWSTSIEYRVDTQGLLTRRQDGHTDVIGAGFTSMTFVATERGSFHVTATTMQLEPQSGVSENLTHEMDIAPVN